MRLLTAVAGTFAVPTPEQGNGLVYLYFPLSLLRPLGGLRVVDWWLVKACLVVGPGILGRVVRQHRRDAGATQLTSFEFDGPLVPTGLSPWGYFWY